MAEELLMRVEGKVSIHLNAIDTPWVHYRSRQVLRSSKIRSSMDLVLKVGGRKRTESFEAIRAEEVLDESAVRMGGSLQVYPVIDENYDWAGEGVIV